MPRSTAGHPYDGPLRWRLSRRGGFWLVVFLVFTGLLGSYSLTPLYPIYQERWHFSDVMLSVAFACYSLGTIVSLLVAGSLSDRIGRRKAFVPALLGVAASMLVLAFAVDLPMLLTGRALQGVFTGIINGTAGAALMDLQPRGDRRVAALANSTSIAVGSAFGPLIAGLLVAHAPSPTLTPYLLVLLLLAIGLLGVTVMPETVPPEARIATGRRRLRAPDDRAGFAVACLGALACNASMSLYAEFGTPLAAQAHLHGRSMGGLVVFVMFAAIGIVQLLLRRVQPLPALVSGTLVVTLGWAGITLALIVHQPALFLSATVIAGAGAGLALMGGTAAVNHLAAPERRAEAVSFYLVVMFCALAGPGIGGGALTQAIHLTGAATVMLVTTAVIALATFVGARRPRIAATL
ncbi:MFS transporter [Actinoallomurus acaciae]|uniref:MFS transporter n=1 Tax=Actinoallomurus acaciae TaxID=502577 RepID=A0ABV5YD44_9ACTN